MNETLTAFTRAYFDELGKLAGALGTAAKIGLIGGSAAAVPAYGFGRGLKAGERDLKLKEQEDQRKLMARQQRGY